MNPLIEHLNNEEFWDAVVQKLHEIRSNEDSANGFEDIPFDEADLLERTEFDLDKSFSSDHWFRELVTKHVLSSIDAPSPITLNDFTEAARAQLAGIRFGEFESAKERFVVYVSLLMTEIDSCNDAGESLALGEWSHPPSTFPDGCGTLYESLDGRLFEVKILGEKQKPELYGPDWLMEAVIRGDMSVTAMAQIVRHVRSVLPSFVETIRLLSPEEGLFSSEARNLFAAFAGWGIHETIDSETHSDEDRLEPRIQNAIELMRVAQPLRPSISAALHFSAIEALVCRGTNKVGQQIRQRVATLLQPDASDRILAITSIGQLYAYRCRILHGDTVHDDHETFERIQRLAVGVLSATVEWLNDRKSTDDVSGRSSFIDDLEHCTNCGKKIDEVPNWYSRLLPPTQ